MALCITLRHGDGVEINGCLVVNNGSTARLVIKTQAEVVRRPRGAAPSTPPETETGD